VCGIGKDLGFVDVHGCIRVFGVCIGAILDGLVLGGIGLVGEQFGFEWCLVPGVFPGFCLV
jgi:hypothetical protein